MVIIEKLRLINFKNFEDLSFEPGPGFHFIAGQNGAGKTNLLDSIFFLAMTKSFIQTSDRELITNHAEFLRIEATCTLKAKLEQVEIKCKPPQIREWWVNGKKYDRLSEHIGHIPIVLVAPDDVYLLMHSADARRKFLSQILVQTDKEFLYHSVQYNHYLKQKNAALKLMLKNGRLDPILLDAFDQGLANHGRYMILSRQNLVDLLNPILSNYIDKISNGKQTGMLHYCPDITGDLEDVLLETRVKDFHTGRSNRGPHKDKVDASMGASLIYSSGSQGQLKTFVSAMKLAQFRYMSNQMKVMPIVLLDDIFAKLDAERIQSILQLLLDEHVYQCFITDTHQERLKQLSKGLNVYAKVYNLEHNQLISC
mgnify:CR=1 FL=1